MCVDTTSIARDFCSSRQSAKVNLVIKFQDTWLKAPKPEHKGDTIGVWPAETKFPTADSHFIPPSTPRFPNAIPVKFQDEEIGAFLERRSLGESNKVQLLPILFDPPIISVEKNRTPLL